MPWLEGNAARKLFDSDIGGAAYRQGNPSGEWLELHSYIEYEIERLAEGEKPYRTVEDLSDRGKKVDAKIDISYNDRKEVIGYRIKLDSEVEKDIAKRVHAYIHEQMHRLYFPEEDGDGEDAVEYLTGMVLRDISENSGKGDVRELAGMGYKEWLTRQHLAGRYGRSETGLETRYLGRDDQGNLSGVPDELGDNRKQGSGPDYHGTRRGPGVLLLS